MRKDNLNSTNVVLQRVFALFRVAPTMSINTILDDTLFDKQFKVIDTKKALSSMHTFEESIPLLMASGQNE